MTAVSLRVRAVWGLWSTRTVRVCVREESELAHTAQVVAGAVAAPERRADRAAVDALAALGGARRLVAHHRTRRQVQRQPRPRVCVPVDVRVRVGVDVRVGAGVRVAVTTSGRDRRGRHAHRERTRARARHSTGPDAGMSGG